MQKTIFYNNDYIKKLFQQEFKNDRQVKFVRGMVQDNTNQDIFKKTEILIIHISSKLDRQMIDSFSNLKMIATYSTGTDHIDLNYAQKKNILVKNIPAYGSRSVAEAGMALLFNIARKINLAEKILKKEKTFLVKKRTELRGFKIEGKKIGIIGVGRIGKEMIKMAQAMGMEILAFDIYKDQDFAKKYNFSFVSLKNLLKQADVISLHLPLTEKTDKILGKNEFDLMKEGLVIINTARGGLIDEKILLTNLKKGKIFGAGLDVLADEENIFNLKLKNKVAKNRAKINREIIKHPAVIVNPHNAYNTTEAIITLIKETVRNIQSFENKK